ncbi:MAG: hypothetical protein KDI27_02115 [Gammaproteobacteria bacterium]|nr:hypothetical protein [Gammaproteobacteria bacterium]MCB1851712.1 hypothetical protein [Gammaproteobacteria bacterium]MCP5417934.1 hypothetical protein [Chromatiaceae bacterium]
MLNLTRYYIYAICLVCCASLLYIYGLPPDSLRQTRDGVPFFTPPVIHPETGEPLDLGELVRHFKGE